MHSRSGDVSDGTNNPKRSAARLPGSVDSEFERGIREERLPEDLSAMELLSGEVELTFPQRAWLDA